MGAAVQPGKWAEDVKVRVDGEGVMSGRMAVSRQSRRKSGVKWRGDRDTVAASLLATS